MVDRYTRLSPEEQRVLLATMLGVAASLWLSFAWEEPMVLLAIPLLALVGLFLTRAARKRVQRQTDDWLY